MLLSLTGEMGNDINQYRAAIGLFHGGKNWISNLINRSWTAWDAKLFGAFLFAKKVVQNTDDENDNGNDNDG